MSTAPATPCTAPHCRRLATDERGRCAEHRRPTAHQRGYTSEWATYARDWLNHYPWCGQRNGGEFSGEYSFCARARKRVRARVVDHIRPIAMGGAELDPLNHQSLCHSCNARKKVSG